MGSGDLNMKKSWHPQTRANQLRVAEEKRKAEEEARRTANIQKELREERQREEMLTLNATVTKKAINKLDWMYNTPAQQQQQQINEDREAYLLGKKNLTDLFQQNKQTIVPQEEKWKGGLFAFSNRNANNDKDSIAKSLEDPLAEIKRREQEIISEMRAQKNTSEKHDDRDRKRRRDKHGRDKDSSKSSRSRHRSRSRSKERHGDRKDRKKSSSKRNSHDDRHEHHKERGHRSHRSRDDAPRSPSHRPRSDRSRDDRSRSQSPSYKSRSHRARRSESPE